MSGIGMQCHIRLKLNHFLSSPRFVKFTLTFWRCVEIPDERDRHAVSQGLVLRAGEDAGMPGVDVGDVAVTDARDRLPGEEAAGTRHGRVLYENDKGFI